MAMCEMKLAKSGKVFEGVLVALANKEVRLYNKKSLINSSVVEDSVMGLFCGVFGREDGNLIISTQNGWILAKILSRKEKLDTGSDISGPPPEQDEPINVPKKTKL